MIVLSLEVESSPSPTDDGDDDVAASEEEDATLDFATACVLIEPFHKTAKCAKGHKGQDSLKPVCHRFAS